MPRQDSNVGHTGGLETLTAPHEVLYAAFEALPRVCRDRLNEATIPLDPLTLARYWRDIQRAGHPAEVATRAVLEAIANTETLYAGLLEKERATWRLGEEMAAGVKSVTARLRGARSRALRS